MKIFKIFFIISLLAIALFTACDKDDSAGTLKFSADDLNKFVGNWAGTYTVLNITTADTLNIALGSAGFNFSIIIHVNTINPDTVNGNLEDEYTINIPEQEMGGAPGTARIIYNNAVITYSQTGFGITGSGDDYTKF